MSDLIKAFEAATISDFHHHEDTNLAWQNTVLTEVALEEAQDEIMSWAAYEVTPLISLDKVAEMAGVGTVSYKDESPRFGLGSFKALGGAFAVLKLLSSKLGVPTSEILAGKHKAEASKICVATATDGNHGRSVAWGAQQAGCACNIYIHAEVSKGREDAMAAYGANVVRIDGDYDQSVHLCTSESIANGWYMVSDTSFEGYTEVPAWVMAGYSVLGREAVEQAPTPYTHLIVQAGVGGMACGVVSGIFDAVENGPKPKVIVVETDMAPCLIESLRQKKPVSVEVTEETIMAGLSCGEPSVLALEVLTNYAGYYMTMPDDGIAATMRAMANLETCETSIEAGECSATGVVAMFAMTKDAKIKELAGLDDQSHVMILGTEGATDAEIYSQIMQGVSV